MSEQDQVQEEVKEEKVKKEKPKKDKQIKVSEAEYNKLQEDLAEIKDRNVRLVAEFENVRKRTERERADLIKYAHEEVIIELLGIMDDFERSFQAAKAKTSEGDNEIVKGIEMVLGRMIELLKKYDVKPIESVGNPFDPNSQEALMHEETEEHEDGIVIEEYQKGFYLGERVVRTAKVKVAKNNKK